MGCSEHFIECAECSRENDEKIAEARSRAEAAETEAERLRNVIRTGGAMYRLERATLGIPGGHDPAQHEPDWKRLAREAWEGWSKGENVAGPLQAIYRALEAGGVPFASTRVDAALEPVVYGTWEGKLWRCRCPRDGRFDRSINGVYVSQCDACDTHRPERKARTKLEEMAAAVDADGPLPSVLASALPYTPEVAVQREATPLRFKLPEGWSGGHNEPDDRGPEDLPPAKLLSGTELAIGQLRSALGIRDSVDAEETVKLALRRLSRSVREEVRPSDMERLRTWLARPNGALVLGRRLTLEAVAHGGIFVRTWRTEAMLAKDETPPSDWAKFAAIALEELGCFEKARAEALALLLVGQAPPPEEGSWEERWANDLLALEAEAREEAREETIAEVIAWLRDGTSVDPRAMIRNERGVRYTLARELEEGALRKSEQSEKGLAILLLAVRRARRLALEAKDFLVMSRLDSAIVVLEERVGE